MSTVPRPVSRPHLHADHSFLVAPLFSDPPSTLRSKPSTNQPTIHSFKSDGFKSISCQGKQEGLRTAVHHATSMQEILREISPRAPLVLIVARLPLPLPLHANIHIQIPTALIYPLPSFHHLNIRSELEFYLGTLRLLASTGFRENESNCVFFHRFVQVSYGIIHSLSPPSLIDD